MGTGMRNQPQGRLQLDSGNPITRGLAFAFVSINGQAVGWRAGKAATVAAATNVLRAMTPQGKAMTAASAGDAIYDTGLTGITGSNYGLFVAATANTSGVQSAVDDDSGSGSGARVLQFRLNTFKVDLITFDTDGNPYFATAVAPLSAAQMNAGFTMGAQVAGNAIAVFQNGQKTAGAASGTPKTSLGDLRIGNYKGGGSTGWNTGGISLAVGWSRTPTDAEMQSMAANPWQLFQAPDEDIFVPAAASGVVFAGSAIGGASATGTLSTAIPLIGSGAGASAGAASLSTSIRLAGAASTTAATSGALSTAIRIVGLASVTATANGALSTGIALSGLASASASAVGGLSTAISLSGGASAQGSASGTLGTVAAGMIGSALAAAAATGALSTAIALGGAAVVSASGSAALIAAGAGLSGTARAGSTAAGALTTAIVLSGVAPASAGASGTLAAPGAVLSGAAAASGAAAGALSTSIPLVSTAASAVIALGQLTTAIRLVGGASSSAQANGALTVGVRYVRAPGGSGYTPAGSDFQRRPADTASPRPPDTQRDYR